MDFPWERVWYAAWRAGCKIHTSQNHADSTAASNVQKTIFRSQTVMSYVSNVMFRVSRKYLSASSLFVCVRIHPYETTLFFPISIHNLFSSSLFPARISPTPPHHHKSSPLSPLPHPPSPYQNLTASGQILSPPLLVQILCSLTGVPVCAALTIHPSLIKIPTCATLFAQSPPSAQKIISPGFASDRGTCFPMEE